MRRIAVRTADFRLSFHLMRELKRRECNFVMLSMQDAWDGIWLASPEEVIDDENGTGIPVLDETVEAAVERALQLSKGLENAIQLVFGIDPGPRPGLAWLADGVLFGNLQLEKVEDVTTHIVNLSTSIPHKRMIVKIGNGAPLIRDRIINDCFQLDMNILEVIENKTSSGSRAKAHLHAATRIALLRGKQIYSPREITPTDGDLREIQRQSRIESAGRVTIPTEIAYLVAVGKISLESAIKKA